MEGKRMTTAIADHAAEVERGERFEFGRNWSRFLRALHPRRIERAEASLEDMLGPGSLAGRSFLDVGCGSGLFSLAAHRLGARVHSFDYDPESVACAAELRRRYAPGGAWHVEPGSALDARYIESLGEFDVVYAWGVLHHTGRMWDALACVTRAVAPGGRLFLAIYNACGEESERWRRRKKRYCELPRAVQPVYAAAAVLPYELKAAGRALLDGRPGDYVRSWTRYEQCRGMSRWRDVVDWVGGYPYDVASIDDIVDFYHERGFAPERVVPTGGLGCNEFVFRRQP
jgi:2-polyprenyl-3-methyl-5-hydroxy-6-metoxy-1,4-benzoquinol methylase